MEEQLERNGEERVVELRDVVQAAIDAYHAHDLDRCLSFYAPDVVVKRAEGTIVMAAAEAVKARYAKSMSDHPNLHAPVGHTETELERETGFVVPGSKTRVELKYRLAKPA